jgi:hypothetical protein
MDSIAAIVSEANTWYESSAMCTLAWQPLCGSAFGFAAREDENVLAKDSLDLMPNATILPDGALYD